MKFWAKVSNFWNYREEKNHYKKHSLSLKTKNLCFGNQKVPKYLDKKDKIFTLKKVYIKDFHIKIYPSLYLLKERIT